MALRHSVTQQLTRSLLVLAPARAPTGRRLPLLALGLAASLALAGHVHRGDLPFVMADARTTTALAAPPDDRPSRQVLEQAQLALRLSEARGRELERQVDVLNQRLRESQEELTFFRKARDRR